MPAEEFTGWLARYRAPQQVISDALTGPVGPTSADPAASGLANSGTAGSGPVGAGAPGPPA
jgi:hypothetical protein